MTLPLVIVNPASADGATREKWPKIASDLRTHFGPYSVAMTEAPGHARTLAAEAAMQGSKLSYAAATVQTTLAASPADVLVQIDGEAERRLRVAEFCVANARYYGGAMKIAPDAKLDDGYFDVVTIGDASSFRLLTNAPRLYFGAHLRMSEVTHALAKQVIARPADKDKQVRVELD